MAIPELVIADAPFKKYPGGVIAVRCADWLAGARGTLSTGIDTLASSGNAVRDTQQVTNIIGGAATAYTSADDTLVLTGLPLKNDMYYFVYATIRIEGYLDVTNGAVLRSCVTENWANATIFGIHGAGLLTFTTETTPLITAHCPPPLPYYRSMGMSVPRIPTFRVSDKTQDIIIRMASESGTTIEWLLDQIVFLPVPYNQTNIVGGLDIYGNDIATQDGADGGDANGKFTWFPNQPEDLFSSSGDYQRKTNGDDAEYYVEIDKFDGFYVFDGTHGIAGEAPSWMYSLHTANYRGDRIWSEDTFDNRDTSGGTPPVHNMGISPEGVGYHVSGTLGDTQAFVDGTAGYLQLNNPDGFDEIAAIWGDGISGSADTDNQGIRFQLYDEFVFSGVWENSQGEFASPADSYFFIEVSNTTYIGILTFNTTDKWWSFGTGSFNSGQIDISAWFGIGALVGWKMEFKRYVIRVKLWDASGTEPSTWDYEEFLQLSGNDYPYGDDENISRRISNSIGHVQFFLESQGHTDIVPMEIKLHNVKAEHIAYGDPADMSVRIERPEGTTAGEIVVPFGSSYFVFWGKRDWTEFRGFSNLYAVEFAAKLWNDPAAAEIQRAEGQLFYFFWEKIFPIDLSKIRFRAFGEGDA